MARMPVEPTPTSPRAAGQQTGPGRARLDQSVTKHHAYEAADRISNRRPFDGYLLAMKEDLIDDLQIREKIEAGGILADRYRAFARLVTLRECFFDAVVWAASLHNVEAWAGYSNQYRRYALATEKMAKELLALEQDSEGSTMLLDALHAAVGGK